MSDLLVYQLYLGTGEDLSYISIMLITSGPWSSSTAMLHGVGSGPVKVCTDKICHFFSRHMLRFQWDTIVGY